MAAMLQPHASVSDVLGICHSHGPSSTKHYLHKLIPDRLHGVNCTSGIGFSSGNNHGSCSIAHGPMGSLFPVILLWPERAAVLSLDSLASRHGMYHGEGTCPPPQRKIPPHFVFEFFIPILHIISLDSYLVSSFFLYRHFLEVVTVLRI